MSVLKTKDLPPLSHAERWHSCHLQMQLKDADILDGPTPHSTPCSLLLAGQNLTWIMTPDSDPRLQHSATSIFASGSLLLLPQPTFSHSSTTFKPRVMRLQLQSQISQVTATGRPSEKGLAALQQPYEPIELCSEHSRVVPSRSQTSAR